MVPYTISGPQHKTDHLCMGEMRVASFRGSSLHMMLAYTPAQSQMSGETLELEMNLSGMTLMGYSVSDDIDFY